MIRGLSDNPSAPLLNRCQQAGPTRLLPIRRRRRLSRVARPCHDLPHRLADPEAARLRFVALRMLRLRSPRYFLKEHDVLFCERDTAIRKALEFVQLRAQSPDLRVATLQELGCLPDLLLQISDSSSRAFLLCSERGLFLSQPLPLLLQLGPEHGRSRILALNAAFLDLAFAPFHQIFLFGKLLLQLVDSNRKLCLRLLGQ